MVRVKKRRDTGGRGGGSGEGEHHSEAADSQRWSLTSAVRLLAAPGQALLTNPAL